MYKRTNINYSNDGEELIGPEEATPWHVFQQQSAGQKTRPNPEEMSDEDEGVYIRNADRQRILKQRDESYRKFLIEESKKDDAKWDSFSDGESPKGTEDSKVTETPLPPKEKKSLKRKSVVEVPNEEPEPEVKPKVPKFKAESKEKNPPDAPKKKLKKKRGEPKASAKKPEDDQLDSTPESSLPDGNKFAAHLMCLGCREAGHRLKNCPKFRTAVCIKCGSPDHRYQDCKSGGDFKFATCFVCKETGHLSKQCPKNTNGVYPNGGACRYCQSVDHLAQDCRVMKRNKKRDGKRSGEDSPDKRKSFGRPRGGFGSRGSDRKSSFGGRGNARGRPSSSARGGRFNGGSRGRGRGRGSGGQRGTTRR